jgi:antitoxin component YwqK of YwqJK toxin-antitoxin module
MFAGKKEGFAREYDWHGKLFSEARYKEGYAAGDFVRIFDKDGTIKFIGPARSMKSTWLY